MLTFRPGSTFDFTSFVVIMDFPRIKKILIRILFLNWLVAGIKIIVGFYTGSLGILTDGFHSLFDGSSNIVGWLGIKMAEKPTDIDHPYGHRKYEAFASLGILFLAMLSVYEFGKNIIQRVIHPRTLEISYLSIAVLFSALAIDWVVARYEYQQGRKLKSTILVADSMHTKTHIFTTSAVIIGALAVKFGFSMFDTIAASFVLFMLIKLTYDIFNETASVLCDHAFIDASKVLEIVKNFPEIKLAHKIRTRGDHLHIFLDMHISLDSNMPLKQAHLISHNLKNKIQEEIPEIKDIIIHIEPER